MSRIFACLFSLMFAASFSTAQSSSPGPGNQTLATAMLADGTPLRLRTSRTVSSADSRTGDVVEMEVLDEVRVNDTLVVPKGAMALAIVTAAEPKKTMGRGGKLDINIDSVKLVDGQKIALRAVKQSSGITNPASIVSAATSTDLTSAPLLFVRGKDVVIPMGSEVTAYINGNVPLAIENFKPAILEAKASAKALANSATELDISSYPSAAEIQIDGKFIGMTPTAVIVRSGPHNVEVRLAGFRSWHQTVTAAGNRQAFNLRLQQDGLNGSTVSNCSGTDCYDLPLGDIAKDKRENERSSKH